MKVSFPYNRSSKAILLEAIQCFRLNTSPAWKFSCLNCLSSSNTQFYFRGKSCSQFMVTIDLMLMKYCVLEFFLFLSSFELKLKEVAKT